MLRLVALALVASAGVLASSQPAECTWCPTYTCHGPCGQGCACISQPGDASGGRCYGVQHAERLLAQGGRELR
jgi:hypothetical protein